MRGRRGRAGMAPQANAPPWVLLRGLVREARHWGDFPDRMVAAWPDSRVTCPDLPGNGRRNAERSPATVGAMVEDCRAGLIAEGIEPPWQLLALSLGGMIAAAWATSHPQEIAGMVLINTSMRPFCALHRRLRPQNYPALMRTAIDDDVPRRETRILGMVSNDPARRSAALAPWIALAREHPVRPANALRQLTAAAMFNAGRPVPAAPALVLASARDRLVDPACSRAIAQAWNAPLALHADAGHDLPLDDPAWVVSQVARHFVPTRENPCVWAAS